QSFNLVTFIKDFGGIVLKELDFQNEVSNMKRFGHMFIDNETCSIPEIYTQYCTPRLLVMEYIQGISPDSIAQLRANGFDPQKIAENGVNIILTMILKHGFFHAD